MRKSQSSMTAVGIAFVRAIESEKPTVERGFTQVYDANFKYRHDTYFTGAKARRTVADGYAIVSAVVRPRGTS